MRIPRSLVALPVVAALAAACWEGPKVLQGTVVSYDAARSVAVVRDELGGAEVAFDVAGAEVGAEPAPGDLVRLAYREKGGRNVASRLMNLTRQADLGKKGGH